MSFGRTGQVSNIVLHDLRSFGFCSLNTPPHVKSSFIWAQNDYRETTLSCPESPRPVFIFLQGGHHVELSSWYGITTFLDPIMNKLQSELSSCWERVKILFSGATVCSDEVVKKYPHQNRDTPIFVAALKHINHPRSPRSLTDHCYILIQPTQHFQQRRLPNIWATNKSDFWTSNRNKIRYNHWFPSHTAWFIICTKQLHSDIYHLGFRILEQP